MRNLWVVRGAIVARGPSASRGPTPSAMRSPGGGGQQLDLLRRDQRAELHGKALDEVLVGEDGPPVRAAVGVVGELPQMDQLVDHAGIGLEVADQLLVVAALLEGRVAELGVELDGLGHLADVKRVGPHLIDGHGGPPGSWWPCACEPRACWHTPR